MDDAQPPSAATGPVEGVTCTACGAGAPRPPVTWSSQSGPWGTTWLCADCTRQNLRSIEGRLDEAWW